MIESIVTYLIDGMVNLLGAVLQGLAFIIVGLVYVILYPVDQLILQYIPVLSGALTSVADLFNTISTSLGWCVSLTGLSPQALQLIVAYYVFKLTVPFAIYMIKLALQWYNKLKP